MDETRRNLWVGLFVLCGLAALGALIVLFGRGPTWLTSGDTYPLHIQFDQVSDIRPGNLVNAKGITIGRVTSVDLLDPLNFDAGVDVLVAIENRYPLHEGAAAVTREPMLGQARPPIDILPGPAGADALVPGASLRGTVQKALDAIFPSGVVSTFETSARQIGDAAEALTPVLQELEQLMQFRSPADVDRSPVLAGNLSSAVARLDATLKHFNDVLGDPAVRSNLRETLANIHEMSEQGKKVMSDLETAAGESRALMGDTRELIANADRTVTNLDGRTNDVAAAAVRSLDRLDEFMGQLNVIGQKITNGEGNIGRLIMDDTLYDSLRITTERLGLLVEEFRALVAKWHEGRIKVSL